MSALLMAAFLRGIDDVELEAIADAMLESGERLTWPEGGVYVDKHSTGGVGDKISLILAPLVASCGVAVPMMSGRSLGHTGGTLDKLEAIPGFRTALSLEEVREQISHIGCAMFGQTREIAPADRKLYALRDATGTVESIPLIAASIMSKKLAEGLTGLVLDVKWGSGAFLPEPERGMELARTMMALGARRGCPTVALLTAMDRPLGRAIGNALETEEAIMTLRGEGPSDVLEVTYALGVEMLVLAGISVGREDARRVLREALESGRALEAFRQVIEAQGGNPAIVDDPAALPQAAHQVVVRAEVPGIVQTVEPRTLGRAVVSMGGGRQHVDDAPDPSVGFTVSVQPGHRVTEGEPLATVWAADDAGAEDGRRAVRAAIRIGEEPIELAPLVSHRVTARGAANR
jgi:pyrimidine-nucleoside phosphorylase